MVVCLQKKKNESETDVALADRGDQWDHCAIDAETRLVVSLVIGKRTEETANEVLKDFAGRIQGIPELITSDEHAPYPKAVARAFPHPDYPGTRANPKPHPHVRYATVHKLRKKGRVIKVERRVVFGTQRAVKSVLRSSTASRSINTSFVERINGTDRHRNKRKARDTLCFSKNLVLHHCASYISLTAYNFCFPVAGLAKKGTNTKVTPAMAAGIAEKPYSLVQVAQQQLAFTRTHDGS